MSKKMPKKSKTHFICEKCNKKLKIGSKWFHMKRHETKDSEALIEIQKLKHIEALADQTSDSKEAPNFIPQSYHGYDVVTIKPTPPIITNSKTERDAHFERVQRLFNDCFTLMVIKNKGYTGNDSDPYSNFRNAAFDRFINRGFQFRGQYDSVIQGIITRFQDKVKRIENIVYTGEINFDSLDDTLEDAINYMAILFSYLHSERR